MIKKARFIRAFLMRKKYLKLGLGPRFYPAENFFVGAQIGLGVLTGTATSV
ncbi:MAG: hypothetical protein JST68_13700 [Bacteroidetes bacterium]|nr:hypothetical protein [Bacteroidota bacterium]